MAWMDIKEFSARRGISGQAVRKGIKAGRYRTRTEPHPTRPDQVSYLVWSEDGDPVDEGGSHGAFNAESAGSSPAGVANNLSHPPALLLSGASPHAPHTTAEVIHDLTDMHIKEPESIHEIETLAVATTPEPQLPAVVLSEKEEFESHGEREREAAWAKLAIVQAFKETMAQREQGQASLAQAFVNQVNSGKLCQAARQALGRKVTMKSVYRWAGLWKKSGSATYPTVLIDRRPGLCGRKSAAGQEVRFRIRQLAADPRRLDGTHIARIIKEEYPSVEISERTVQHLVKAARQDRFLVAGLSGPTRWKNEARPHNKLINDLEPNGLWESDGKTMNNLVLSPFWFHKNEEYRYIIRPVLVAWFDVATGLITGWALGASETFHLVKTAFVEGICAWGVPRKVKTDNGGSFNNIYTNTEKFAFQKRETDTKKKALQLYQSGYRGFYQGFGVERVGFTIPGNSESKQIEAAWGYALREFEKSQLMYTGESPETRPEYMNLTKKALLKRYGEQLVSWEEYQNRIEGFINHWNNEPREVLRRADGTSCSPAEMFSEFRENINRPLRELVEHRNWLPTRLTVQRDGIYVNGLWYRHPNFGIYSGREVLVEYNESNIYEVTVADLDGAKWSITAKLLLPGSHIDQEQAQAAIADRARYEQAMRLTYAMRLTQGDKLTMAEMNRLSGSVAALLDDQSRKQELEKAVKTGLPQQKALPQHRYKADKQETILESLEDEIAACAEQAGEPEPSEPDEDDVIIAEIRRSASDYGLH